MTDIDKHPADLPAEDPSATAETETAASAEIQDDPPAAPVASDETAEASEPTASASQPEREPEATPADPPTAPPIDQESVEAVAEEPATEATAAEDPSHETHEDEEGGAPVTVATDDPSQHVEHHEDVAPDAGTEETAAASADSPDSGSEPSPTDQAAESPVDQAAAEAELLAEASRWGTVDEEGNVRQRHEDGSPGRILGHVEGGDPEAALRSFARKYRQAAAKVDTLERDLERSRDRARLIGRIHLLLEWLPTADALGDLDALRDRLTRLEEACQEHLQENLRRKEELCGKAEELVESTAWTKTAEALKALQEEWKGIGPVPKEQADALWSRFRQAANQFFERRKAHHAERDRAQQENLERKEALCVRAEELSGSTAWTKGAEALKGLQEEWRHVGPVPREQAEAVWARFRGAMDAFFERRKVHFKEVDHQLKENLRRKEALCVRAEELSTSTDWKATTEEIKTLQSEWKSLGPVPHKQSEAIWARFRGAIDVFFARSGAAYEERARERQGRTSDWKDRLRETLDRKREQADRIRESIGRDDENLARWQDTLANLRPGPRSGEIRAGLDEKIGAVEERRASKQARLAELDEAVKEIEGKL